ncbi:SpoIIE family protein phosphatase [Streptomyces sp. NPDC002911]
MNDDAAAAAGESRSGPSPIGRPVVSVDDHGRLTAWSAGAQWLLGYEPVEVVGRPAAALLVGTLPATATAACEIGHRWSGSITLQHRDGHRVDVAVEARPLLQEVRTTHWVLSGRPSVQGEAEATALFKEWALDQISLPMALFDRAGLAISVNAAMERAMGKSERELLGVRIGTSGPGQPIAGMEEVEGVVARVLRDGETVPWEVYLRAPGEARPHAWLLSLSPVRDDRGTIHAMSMAAMDTTEPFRARRRLSMLNDAGLHLGTTLDLRRTAEELAAFACDHFADFAVVDLLEPVLQGEDMDAVPQGDVLLFRRTAQHSVLAGCPEAVVAVGATHTYAASSPPGRALATGRASLHQVDARDLTSWAAGSSERARSITAYRMHSLMVTPLQARGIPLGLAMFARHRAPEPFDEEDLHLAEELTARAALCVDNARRYARERSVALALQRSLLPQRAPRQSAVEVASRYLPAHSRAGIGGDWFDVIPLSGARVALVVGDVVGHGIQASATMGRLRTAVRTLADVDLAPDELLTQLDDIVLRLDSSDTVDDGSDPADQPVGEMGATCLYAVYDPISGRCAMARAGHPPPTLVTPGGTVRELDIPAGPPLGVGGLPFEVTEFELSRGSVLALYTDGLFDTASADSHAQLHAVLAARDRALEDTCDAVMRNLSSERRADDAALLLARPLSLDSDRVATWELPSDPAVVARARELARAQLSAWHLEEVVFTTELVVSELVTNAVRYGGPPVQLRLILDNTLICEVSDGSNAAPHLRRARYYDEGGRGLMIVAQIVERWGSRSTGVGKTIWTEQLLPA